MSVLGIFGSPTAELLLDIALIFLGALNIWLGWQGKIKGTHTSARSWTIIVAASLTLLCGILLTYAHLR